MKDARDCTNMIEIRTAIDIIDNQIVELIASRSKYVNEAAKFKKDEKAVTDSNRVQKVINRIRYTPQLCCGWDKLWSMQPQ